MGQDGRRHAGWLHADRVRCLPERRLLHHHPRLGSGHIRRGRGEHRKRPRIDRGRHGFQKNGHRILSNGARQRLDVPEGRLQEAGSRQAEGCAVLRISGCESEGSVAVISPLAEWTAQGLAGHSRAHVGRVEGVSAVGRGRRKEAKGPQGAVRGRRHCGADGWARVFARFRRLWEATLRPRGAPADHRWVMAITTYHISRKDLDRVTLGNR